MGHAPGPESHIDTVGRVSPARWLKPYLSEIVCERAESREVAQALWFAGRVRVTRKMGRLKVAETLGWLSGSIG